MNMTYKIEIYGHTDNTGSAEHNQQLSEDRATAVATYLINKGIVNSRIITKGYGSTKPLSSNSTEEGKRKNRRVEFKLVAE